MYERLPLDYINLTDGFGYRKDPISGADSYHYAIDLGWHKTIGSPIYAIYDSKVVYEGYDSDLGNYIVLTYDKTDCTIIYRFLHMRDRSLYKKGDNVKRKDIVGYMGTTGYSTGVHLHFEYWICPKGYNYSSGDRSKYAKNPFQYCYLFEDQETSAAAKNYVIKVVGTAIQKSKDTTKNQLEVVLDKLRCRKSGSLEGDILGYIDYGIYDILDKVEKDNYTWYKIANEKWVAAADNSIKLYLINDKDNSDLTINDKLKNYQSYTSLKDDYYYIYLKKDETIYFPK